MRRGGASVAIGCALLLASLLLASSAAAVTYAPVDQPGPALSVPQSDLDNALQCTDNLSSAGKTPVLLVPGTGGDPPQSFGWSWEPSLERLGIPWCTVTLPDHTQGDIQIAGEYVVNAIRTMYGRAGRSASGRTRGQWSTTTSESRRAITAPPAPGWSASSAVLPRTGSRATRPSSSRLLTATWLYLLGPRPPRSTRIPMRSSCRTPTARAALRCTAEA